MSCIRKLVIVMKSGVFKNTIESSGRQKPIPLTSICGHFVDKIIKLKFYGETSGEFCLGNELLLKIWRQLIVNRMESERYVELKLKDLNEYEALKKQFEEKKITAKYQ